LLVILFGFISALVVLSSVLAATHALLSKRDSNSALAWVAFCLFMPLAGPIFYLVFGINRIQIKAKELYDDEPAQTDSDDTAMPTEVTIPFAIIGKSVSGRNVLPCSSIEILENGEGLYPKMLVAINAAKYRAYLSSYIFQDDTSGQLFLKALVDAQNRGVDVRIIIDGLGAILYPPRIDKKLFSANLRVRLFDPAKLIPPSLHINMRNHRKLLVVDQEVAFTGGQNISDRHLVKLPDNKKKALDLHFSFTGKIAVELEKTFLKDWESCSSHSSEPLSLSISKPTPKPKPIPKYRNHEESVAWTRVILDGPNENLDRLNELLVGMFSLAKKRIWIMTPYFLPAHDLVGAMIGAKHRGVDVKIILPARTNLHITHWATQHSLQHIHARGLTVFLQPAPFVHTKAIVIDDKYALVGSANLDPRSLRLNFELGVEIFSKEFNDELSHYFKSKLAECEKLNPESLKNQPLARRIRNAVAWLFTPYL
jgi:cardiolipin synthase